MEAVDLSDPDNIPTDLYDGLILTEWLEAYVRRGRVFLWPAPLSGVMDEVTLAHENSEAWQHVKLPEGMTRDQALQVLEAVPRG